MDNKNPEVKKNRQNAEETSKVAKKTVKRIVKKSPKKKASEITGDAYQKAIKVLSSNKGNKKGSNLCIDYPTENEVINGHFHYALRIGASNDGYVEISFNDGEWNLCRYNCGYWWFDIMYFKLGDYKLCARMMDVDGNVIVKTKVRKFSIC
jgi:hypothetical protein